MKKISDSPSPEEVRSALEFINIVGSAFFQRMKEGKPGEMTPQEAILQDTESVKVLKSVCELRRKYEEGRSKYHLHLRDFYMARLAVECQDACTEFNEARNEKRDYKRRSQRVNEAKGNSLSARSESDVHGKSKKPEERLFMSARAILRRLGAFNDDDAMRVAGLMEDAAGFFRQRGLSCGLEELESATETVLEIILKKGGHPKGNRALGNLMALLIYMPRPEGEEDDVNAAILADDTTERARKRAKKTILQKLGPFGFRFGREELARIIMEEVFGLSHEEALSVKDIVFKSWMRRVCEKAGFKYDPATDEIT